jgi:hypothetical protein
MIRKHDRPARSPEPQKAIEDSFRSKRSIDRFPNVNRDWDFGYRLDVH